MIKNQFFKVLIQAINSSKVGKKRSEAGKINSKSREYGFLSERKTKCHEFAFK
jgi:hypothetical protein